MKNVFKPVSCMLAILILVLFSACDSMVDQSLETTTPSEGISETAAKNAGLRGIFARAAIYGENVAVSVLSPSGEIIEDFKGSPAAAQAFLDAQEAVEDLSAGKSMGGDLPWIQYVLRYPSSVGFSSTSSTEFTLLFPDMESDWPARHYSIESVFWDDDIPMRDPVVNYNGTPGYSSVSTSTTEYPGPSGTSGWHNLYGGPSLSPANGYHPCEAGYTSNSDYGIKGYGVYGLEWSPDYQITLDVGACLGGVDIIHASSSYPTNGPWTDEGGNVFRRNNAGSSVFAFTAEYTTDPGSRWYDLTITGGICTVSQQSGYPAISGPQISMRPDMSLVSVGSYWVSPDLVDCKLRCDCLRMLFSHHGFVLHGA